MPRPSSKEDLLAKGAAVIHARGYHATGVAEIAAAAGVPKGSFYNHFESKEAFGEEILGRYFENFAASLAECFRVDMRSGAERLERAIDVMIGAVEPSGAAPTAEHAWVGCLLGNFALEVSAHSESLRNKISAYLDQWRALLRDAIGAGQTDGSLTTKLAPDDMAGFFISAWQGAVLRARVAKDPGPLYEFKRAILAQFRD